MHTHHEPHDHNEHHEDIFIRNLLKENAILKKQNDLLNKMICGILHLFPKDQYPRIMHLFTHDHAALIALISNHIKHHTAEFHSLKAELHQLRNLHSRRPITAKYQDPFACPCCHSTSSAHANDCPFKNLY